MDGSTVPCWDSDLSKDLLRRVSDEFETFRY